MRTTDDLLELLDLVRSADGTWSGAVPSGSDRPTLFGGLVAAQALRAAQLSTAPDRSVHSIHALFLRGGRYDEAVHFTVDEARDGRSFSARHVEVHQSGGVILRLLASFQVEEDGDAYQLDAAQHSPPAPDDPGSSIAQSVGMPDPGVFAFVEVAGTDPAPGSLTWSAARYWSRTLHPLSDDPALHACAMVAMGDLRTGSPPHRARTTDGPVRITTLDYSVWFHRPARADDWLLYDLRPAGNGGARGLTYGTIHDASRRQVGSLTMELLLRDERPPSSV